MSVNFIIIKINSETEAELVGVVQIVRCNGRENKERRILKSGKLLTEVLPIKAHQ